MNCTENNIPSWLWNLIKKFPALRYLKAPVFTVQQLYERYLDGLEAGAFAFVIKKFCFYGWDFKTKEWKKIGVTKEDITWENILNKPDILTTDDIPPEYELPVASESTLGGVIIGENLSIDDNGVLSASKQEVSLQEAYNGGTDISGDTPIFLMPTEGSLRTVIDPKGAIGVQNNSVNKTVNITVNTTGNESRPRIEFSSPAGEVVMAGDNGNLSLEGSKSANLSAPELNPPTANGLPITVSSNPGQRYKLWTGSEVNYENISQKDANTIYFII